MELNREPCENQGRARCCNRGRTPQHVTVQLYPVQNGLDARHKIAKEGYLLVRPAKKTIEAAQQTVRFQQDLDGKAR